MDGDTQEKAPMHLVGNQENVCIVRAGVHNREQSALQSDTSVRRLLRPLRSHAVAKGFSPPPIEPGTQDVVRVGLMARAWFGRLGAGAAPSARAHGRKQPHALWPLVFRVCSHTPLDNVAKLWMGNLGSATALSQSGAQAGPGRQLGSPASALGPWHPPSARLRTQESC